MSVTSIRPNPKVVIIVLNWNGTDDTLNCLESLAQLNYDNYSVLVVDNGSAESPVEVINERFPSVDTLTNEVNFGYAGGNNGGLVRAMGARAEFCWVLNNDTIVEPDALTLMVETAVTKPRAAAVGCKVYDQSQPGKLWVAWGRVTFGQSLIALDGEGAPDGPSWDVVRQVEWIPGCSLLFRSEALADVGLFDESYFAYHEDVEWATRARRGGWELWYDGRARIHHAVHGSSGGSSHYGGFRKYLSARNSVLYARKYGTKAEQLKMAAAIAITLPFQFLRRLATGEHPGVIMKIRGWRDALRGRPLPFEGLGLR